MPERPLAGVNPLIQRERPTAGLERLTIAVKRRRGPGQGTRAQLCDEPGSRQARQGGAAQVHRGEFGGVRSQVGRVLGGFTPDVIAIGSKPVPSGGPWAEGALTSSATSNGIEYRLGRQCTRHAH